MNTGDEDAEADGEVPEFDFQHGPGTRLTKGELEENVAGEAPDRAQGSLEEGGLREVWVHR